MKYFQRGQTLIEALIALAIILIIMTSLSTVLATSLYNSQFIKEQNRANKYSQEGVEIVRALQESKIADFRALATDDYCVDVGTGSLFKFGDAASPPPCDNVNAPNVGGNMKRVINIARDPACAPVPGPGDGLSDVTVTTSWNSSKCNGPAFCHEAKVVTSLPCTSGITP